MHVGDASYHTLYSLLCLMHLVGSLPGQRPNALEKLEFPTHDIHTHTTYTHTHTRADKWLVELFLGNVTTSEIVPHHEKNTTYVLTKPLMLIIGNSSNSNSFAGSDHLDKIQDNFRKITNV